MAEVTKETVEDMAAKIGMEGLSYWLTNYAAPKNDGTDLDNAMKEAIAAVSKFESILEGYMEQHEVEYS